MIATHQSSFNSEMLPEEFKRLVQSLKRGGETLERAYELAEYIHEDIYNGQRRYSEWTSFKSVYFRKPAAEKAKPI